MHITHQKHNHASERGVSEILLYSVIRV